MKGKMMSTYTQYRVEFLERRYGTVYWEAMPEGEGTYLSLERLLEEWPDVDTNPDMRITTRTLTDWSPIP